MYFQKIVKGVGDIGNSEAEQMLLKRGIVCNWWRRVHTISDSEIQDKLTDENLYWHLNQYDDHDPRTGRPFSEDTPFISTTAGAVERDAFLARNIIYVPLITALNFATDTFTKPGYVFYGYLFTLGKKSLELAEFAEEVRELHIYTGYLPYHDEGEIIAKIHIPAIRLERVERYEPDPTKNQISRGQRPVPIWHLINPNYANPEKFANIRGLLT
jgi:hypothetical protein